MNSPACILSEEPVKLAQLAAIKIGIHICTSKKVKRVLERRILGYKNYDLDRYIFNVIANPKITPVKYPITKQNNSDKALLLYYITEQLTRIGCLNV